MVQSPKKLQNFRINLLLNHFRSDLIRGLVKTWKGHSWNGSCWIYLLHGRRQTDAEDIDVTTMWLRWSCNHEWGRNERRSGRLLRQGNNAPAVNLASTGKKYIQRRKARACFAHLYQTTIVRNPHQENGNLSMW